MADNVSYTPDDMIGAVHRQTVQLAQYLQMPINEINPGVALDHVVRMHAWLSRLNEIYIQMGQQSGRGDGDGAGATKQ